MPFLKNFFYCSFFLFILNACNKDSFTGSPDATLRTSVDTLHFDTVFTSTGSVTQTFKIINGNEEDIRVSSVRLAGGASSPFKINVDGIPGPQASNIEIKKRDSIYVFVTVSINPSPANMPFIVRDSVEIISNGNRKYVQLEGYGQNAHFLRNKEISGTETWNNDLPYVILGQLTVDTGAVLNINKGCRIYIHADAPVIVNGTLQVNGEKWDSTRVVFTGDRLDDPYKKFPGSYPGIIFTDVSRNNVLNYALIKNAYQAIVAFDPAPGGGTKLTLNETIIDNAYDAGILGINTTITAKNVLVSNCGKNIALVKGGNYSFTHCTAASYGNAYLQRRDPVLLVTNFINNTTPPVSLSAAFRNCIFWGEGGGLVKDEVVVLKNGSTPFNVIFDNVLWRVQTVPPNATITGAINGQDPLFDSVNTARNEYSFRLKAGSPAINKGAPTAVNIDLDGAPRPVGQPDLGAYEKQ